MNLKADKCFNPPHIKSLRVLEAGDSFAAVYWNISSSSARYLHKYSYRLNWKIHGRQSSHVANSASSTLVLPSSQQSIVLANLRPLSNYSLRVYSFSHCARSPTISLKVSTRNAAMIQQAVTTLLPIEIGLIVLVLFIWALIMLHFWKLYKKIALVSVMPMGGYYTGHKKNSGASVASRPSNASAVSKTSNVNQFDILEDAICAWRSETVLSRKFQKDQQHSANESRDATLIPENLPTKARSAKASVSSIRRSSHTSLAPGISCPSNYDPDSKLIGHIALSIPAHSPIPYVKINDMPETKGIIQASHSFPVLRKPNMWEKPLPNLPPDEEKKVEERRALENARPGSVALNQRRISTNPYVLMCAQEGGPPRRKVSQVLLGKASNDIRRCSSVSQTKPSSLAFITSSYTKRNSLRRRLSSINTTIQKRFSNKEKGRRKIEKMSSLREGESESTSGEEGPS